MVTGPDMLVTVRACCDWGGGPGVTVLQHCDSRPGCCRAGVHRATGHLYTPATRNYTVSCRSTLPTQPATQLPSILCSRSWLVFLHRIQSSNSSTSVPCSGRE